MLLTSAEIKPKSFESRRNSLFFSLFFFFTRGGCASGSRACLGARLLPQSYQYPSLSEGADRVCGQLRGDKECPFSGVTKSGSLEEGAGKRCSECAFTSVLVSNVVILTTPLFSHHAGLYSLLCAWNLLRHTTTHSTIMHLSRVQ